MLIPPNADYLIPWLPDSLLLLVGAFIYAIVFWRMVR